MSTEQSYVGGGENAPSNEPTASNVCQAQSWSIETDYGILSANTSTEIVQYIAEMANKTSFESIAETVRVLVVGDQKARRRLELQDIRLLIEAMEMLKAFEYTLKENRYLKA